MALTKEQVSDILFEISLKEPKAYMVRGVEDYSVPDEDYARPDTSNQEYWEWNLTYLLLILESENI